MTSIRNIRHREFERWKEDAVWKATKQAGAHYLRVAR